MINKVHLLEKVKADLKKNWLSWVGFAGLIAIGTPLIIYCQLEKKVLAPWDSYMYLINTLTAVLAGWLVAYLVLWFLLKYKLIQIKRSNKRDKEKS